MRLVDFVSEVAATYGISPEEVLKWREARFWMWLLSAREHTENQQIALSSLISLASWNPKQFKKIVSDKIGEMDTEDPETIIERAERIRRMPGSGSSLDPTNRESGGDE